MESVSSCKGSYLCPRWSPSCSQVAACTPHDWPQPNATLHRPGPPTARRSTRPASQAARRVAFSLHRSAARVGRRDGDAGDREGRRLRHRTWGATSSRCAPETAPCSGGGSFHAGTPGPNGLAVSDGIVVGSTDERVFALAADDGHLLWSRRILRPVDSFVDVAPLVVGGLVYTATTGYGPGPAPRSSRSTQRTGAVRWRFEHHSRRVGASEARSRGGTWQTPSLVDGTLYAGTANPLPWGGRRNCRTAERSRAPPSTRIPSSRSAQATGACAGSIR